MTQSSAMRMLVTSATFLLCASVTAAVQVDPALPEYEPAAGGVSGSIKSVGSDTMNNMMTLWAEGFKKYYPNVKVEIEGKGSGTAIPALVEGSSTFGPMSRKAKDAEIDEFEKKVGYKPIQLKTSIDMLAVYVHRDNPVKSLTLQQIDAMFSKTRKGGFKEDILRWGQAGLTGAWANMSISTYGRNSSSGTYGYFKKHALFKGDYKDSVKEQAGSSAVVKSVANDKAGIGYSGIGYKTPDVRAIPVAEDEDEDAIAPTADNAADYPLARFLLLTVNYRPGEKLDPLRAEFLKYVFSKAGQMAIVKDGYLPVDAKTAKAQLAACGIE